MMDPRQEAYFLLWDYEQKGFASDSKRTSSHQFNSREDQALYNELVQGCLREYYFLKQTLNSRVKKAPRAKPLALLMLGSYQILFLDRIPPYAVYSSIKKIAASERFSPMELKFLHGVLKNIERARGEIMAGRADRLARLEATGICIDGDCVFLGIDPSLLMAIDDKKEVVRSILHMRKPLPIVGYPLVSENLLKGASTLSSPLAPRAIVWGDTSSMREDLTANRARVQGEASQWACEQVADYLSKIECFKVLEMAAGKGGKTLGTYSALMQKDSSITGNWIASDASISQSKIFEKDTLPLLHDQKFHCESLLWDWTREELPEDVSANSFDFVWLDSPCSGLGTLAKHPEISLRTKPSTIDDLRKKQDILMSRAAPCVRPGGVLFFTVCTFTQKETRGFVDKFLSQNSNFELVWDRQLLPLLDGMKTNEAFFGAWFRKKSNSK